MKLLLAISGGRDSVALLDALATNQTSELISNWKLKTKNLKLTIAHFNHGTPHAATAKHFMKTLAKKYDLPLHVGRTKKKLKSEADFRTARYAFLRTLKKKLHADRIVTAHTADDQAETVLLNLVRGTGIKGLSGMRADNEDILRPLLDVSREAVNKYVAKYKLGYLDDPTNADPTFTRNFIRKEIIPRLAKLNPKVNAALLRTARHTREAAETFEVIADEWLKAHASKTTIPLAAFSRIEAGLQKTVLRAIYQRFIGDTTGLEEVHVDEVLRMLSGNRGGKQKACGRLIFFTTRVNRKRTLGWKKIGRLRRSF